LLGDGEAAMQEVFHAHLHVLPRFKGDGFGFRFAADYYNTRPSREQLEAAAARVCAQLVQPS
jgi:histidine triad (HIT) family protein